MQTIVLLCVFHTNHEFHYYLNQVDSLCKYTKICKNSKNEVKYENPLH